MLLDLFKILFTSQKPPTRTRNSFERDQGWPYKKTSSTTRSGTKALMEELFGNQCTLVPGCIVCCDLAGGLDHTGIYIGRNRIVEKNGNGKIKKVSLDEFMNSSGLRTGITLFVACSRGEIIHNTRISNRAKEAIGTSDKYDLLTENCHRLTAYCATGKKHSITTFTQLAYVLEKKFGPIEWKSAKYRKP